MVYERFVTQRNDIAPCSLCGGAINNWSNCTTASEAMWLYRASQGRITTTACHVRDLTNDCVGGTNLRQVETVSKSYGISTGMVYQPVDFAFVVGRVSTGRYGSHLNISYAPFVGTPYDRFHGQFRGNHDVFLSRKGATPGTLRTGDPGATNFADIPVSLLQKAAGLLDLGQQTLNASAGTGKCYAYVTPADPATTTTLYHFFIKGKTPVYRTAPFGALYKYIWSGSGTGKVSVINGLHWLQITQTSGATVGMWLHLGPTIATTPL